MNTNLYEVDLLQKYRQSISKRYRGYNRVYQLNVNRLNEHSSSIEAFSEKKSCKNPTSAIIQISKYCHSQTHKNPQNIPKAIIIRSTNAQFSLKQVNQQTEFNHKKFMKTKLVQHSKSSYTSKQQQKAEKAQPVSPRGLQSSVEEYFQNKFKFKKRFGKDTLVNKFGLTQDSEKLMRDQFLRLQPFSPVIRGQKKNTHNKKTKTQNQTIHTNDQQTKRSFLNHTESKKQRILNIKQNMTRMKRTNSYVSQKQEAKEDNLESHSVSVQPSQLIKKFSSQFKSKNLLNDKSTITKVSFPKINCAKQVPTKQVQNIFVPHIELQKNLQKYKKTPLLIRYPFDAKNVNSQSFIVMQAESQTILYGYRSNNVYEIASLTKIMTFYVVLKLVQEHNIDIRKEMVEVQNECASIGGTSADLFPGEVYSIESLLYGLMLPSGNDAALTLAVWGGRLLSPNPEDNQTCVSQFVMLMNKWAKNLNLIETRFANPHGLPNRMSRSTALDVAKLCMICMKNEVFKKVVNTRFYKCVASSKDGRKRFNEWQNTNKLLRRQGFIGIKTGITITAGPCLASAYQFRDKTFFSVILRAKKISRRFKETRKILHWCLTKLYGESLTGDEVEVLKKLKKNNEEIDSDYSEDQSVFCYDTNNSKEFRRRCDIISDM